MKAISEGTHKWYFFRTLDDTIRVKANRLCEKKVKGKNQYILLKNEETVATINTEFVVAWWSDENDIKSVSATSKQSETSSYLPGRLVPLSIYNSPPGTKCPKSIRFWDKSESSLSNWYDLIISTVQKLRNEGILTINDIPISSSTRRYILNDRPYHPYGNQFESLKLISGSPTIYAEAHASAKESRKQCIKLLKHFDISPNDVHLRVE